MLIGENSKPSGRPASPIGPAGSTSGLSAASSTAGSIFLLAHDLTSSTSHLPRLEIDARIDPGVGQVGHQIHDQAEQCENVEIGEHDGVVAIEHAFEAQESEAVEREDCLDQQRAGKEGAD